MKPTNLYVVHCVDAEGPLHESLDATFERLTEIFDLHIEPNEEALRKLQTGEFDLGSGDLEKSVAETLNPAHLKYMKTWEMLDAMLNRLDAPEVRLALPDSAGNGWKTSWHCLAHHGFDPRKNPRRRDLGVHAVFDHYRTRYRDSRWKDGIHWHYHPVPRTRQANHCATHYFMAPAIFEIISRRILERLWFPCVNRPGFHTERPDSHWFLEQWMPFDIANTNMDNASDQPDVGSGRFGDWRRAPKEWGIYHPHPDDYQRPGNCRRSISRSLYLGGRVYRIDQHEVDKAFAQAREEPVVLAFFNHDFRDMVPDVHAMQNMIAKAAENFPDVNWRYADAAEAMREAQGLDDAPHPRIDLKLSAINSSSHLVEIRLDRAPFGPQPWFCYALRDGTVWHDNLDFSLDTNSWSYTFDEQNAQIEEVKLIGVATNARNGRTSVITHDPETGNQQTDYHN